MQTQASTLTVPQNPNLTPSDDDLGVLQHLYLSWCDKLGKKPMRHYERLTPAKLKHYNRIMAWQVTHSTRYGDVAYFACGGQVRLGTIISFDVAHLNRIGIRKGQLTATLHSDGTLYTRDVNQIRKVAFPAYGMVAVYKYPYIHKLTDYGDRKGYKVFDVRRMSETKEARWMRLLQSDGVTVPVPDGFFNKTMTVYIPTYTKTE